VIAAIADGTIDVIASGHDPRGPEDKRLPFADAEPGMAGAETLLPLTPTLVRDGHIDLARAFDLLAGAPARLLGVDVGGWKRAGKPISRWSIRSVPGSSIRTRWQPRRQHAVRPDGPGSRVNALFKGGKLIA
jgi:dihydroorotase